MFGRRRFIKKATTGLVVGLLAPEIFAQTDKRNKIQILHTNDFHSHLEAFPENHPKYPGMGGIAKLKTLIDSAKEEYEHTLLLDSGDILQGTPYFNVFGGVPEIAWMNMAGYSAATLGNHDFDNGVEKLAELTKHAEFEFLNCNYDTTGTALEGKLSPYKIIPVVGKNIGITAVGIDLKGLVPDLLCKGINYLDPITEVQKVVDLLRNEKKCNLVIVLSHLGYQYETDQIDDIKLAQNTHGIDLILGGHTHTFLDQPVVYQNLHQKPVRINQAGWAGLSLGKVVVKI